MFRFPSVICIRCTGFFYLAIIKGPPNDIYCIIEEPYKHYFTEKVSYSRLSQYIKNSAFQAEQYREQEAFARKEIRNPGQYNYPPESLEIISVSSFCNRYGLNLQLPRSIQSVVLYHIGMTYIRSDPYVGMAALYKTLYGDESNIVVLEFANIDSSSWFEQQRTSKTYRMYKTFCDAILFRDEFIWQEKL